MTYESREKRHMTDEASDTKIVEVTQTDEASETEVVEVTQTVATTETTAVQAPAVDEVSAPVREEIVETTTVVTAATPETTEVVYYAPRGAWDFTDGQRIVVGVLLWLNIIVLGIGYMALTGRLAI
jgi:hypothetical protein